MENEEVLSDKDKESALMVLFMANAPDIDPKMLNNPEVIDGCRDSIIQLCRFVLANAPTANLDSPECKARLETEARRIGLPKMAMGR